MPYGVLYPIRKQKCVNHVTKRMGTGLRALTRDYKGGYFFKYTGDVRCFGYHFIRTFANSNEMSSPLRVRNSGRQVYNEIQTYICIIQNMLSFKQSFHLCSSNILLGSLTTKITREFHCDNYYRDRVAI